MRPSRISYRHSRSSERDERERENGSLTGVGRNTRNARISREKSRQMLKFARRKQEGQRRRRRRRRRPRSLSFKRSGGETLIAASNITGEVRTWAPFHSALQLREAERRREEGATQRGYLSWKRELKRLRCSPSSPFGDFCKEGSGGSAKQYSSRYRQNYFRGRIQFWQSSCKFAMFFY